MDMQQIDSWLEALADDVSGPDLEYDPAYLELVQAASGRPETQFGPAEPPAWPLTRDLAQALFDRTRDLRVAVLWGRANVQLSGLEGLPATLALLHGLLSRMWDDVHPRPDPDDGDTFARLSVLGSLDALEGLLGDVRQAQLVMDRRLGGLRVRDVEVALDRLPPRADELPQSPRQIEGMLADFSDLAGLLRATLDTSLTQLKQLQSLMNERFGIDNAVDTKTLRGMLTAVQSLVPAEGAAGDEAAAGADDGDAGRAGEDDGDGDDVPAQRRAPTGSAAGGRRAAGVISIDSRADAVRAIQLICAYLERTEPTNPAQMLLRRAERLIDKNFLQALRDLAPDAVAEVARVLGVDPESLNSDSESY